MAERFPSPFEINTPPGAAGWEELYLYSSCSSMTAGSYEDSQFLVP